MRVQRVIFAAAALLLGGGVWLACNKLGKAEESDASAVKAVAGPIEDAVEATGVVVPFKRVEIKPPIPGRIDTLLVHEGQTVAAGQIVAKMSSNDRAAILDAALAQGPAELKRWKDAYKPTPIVAPLSGVVILCDVVEGQTVGTGQVIYAISDSLIVVAQVDESDIGRIRLGMPGRITLDAYPDQPVRGKVFEILYEGKSVSNVITYGVKIRMERVPHFFRSQMTANVAFILARKKNAVLVPSNAVQEVAGRKQVLVPGQDGEPSPREVETGIESGENVEVVAGLQPGETVVLPLGKYVPQKPMQESPLAFQSPHRERFGKVPKPKKRAR